MGSHDGAELCELIGIFMLTLIRNKYNSNNIGLYRDDGRLFLKIQAARNQKKLKRLFKKCLRVKV